MTGVDPVLIPTLLVIGVTFIGARSVVQVNIDFANEWIGTSLGKRAEDRMTLLARSLAVVMILVVVFVM